VGTKSEDNVHEVVEERVNGTATEERVSGERRQLWSFCQDC
jgi:hypothetical protein